MKHHTHISMLTPDEFQSIIRDNIVRVRATKRMTQKEVSDKTDLTLQGYYLIESGRTKEPAAYTVYKIAKAFGVSLDHIYPSRLQIQRAILLRDRK